MHILITGGAGFVGSGLALHLRQACSDATVVCMDNLYRRGSELNLPRLQKAGVEFHRGDVRDGKSFPVAHSIISIISLSHSAELEQL